MRPLISLFTLLVLNHFGAFAQNPDLKSKFDEYLNALYANETFSGTVLVAKGDQVVYQNGYGYAVAEHQIQNTPKTRFRLGSITKQFTSMAVMQCIEKGKISLEGKITDYLPNYPKTTGNKVTIHHLLNHTSGIPSYTNDKELMKNRGSIVEAPEEFIKRFQDKALEFEPGSDYRYNNSGYYLLGMILEAVEGKPYDEVIANQIFKPLGMHNSGFEHYQDAIPLMANGYSGIGKVPFRSMNIVTDIAYSAGALYSTVEDLLLWSKAFQAGQLISKASMNKILTPGKDDYGYGWSISDIHNRKNYAHGGGIDGFSTFIGIFPEEEVTVIVLSNYEAAQAGKISLDLSAVLLEEEYKVPQLIEALALPDGFFKTYEGTYNLFPDFNITIFEKDKKYYAQATGQQAFELIPENETLFLTKVVDAKIEFVKGDDGKVDELFLHQGGKHPGKRVK